jgi:DNA-cytosine methyltransferase
MESRGLLVPLREVNRFRKALYKRQWLRQLRPPSLSDRFTRYEGAAGAHRPVLAVDQGWRFLALSLAGERALLEGDASNTSAADLTEFLNECSLTGDGLDNVQLVCCSTADDAPALPEAAAAAAAAAAVAAAVAAAAPACANTAATISAAADAALCDFAGRFTFVDLFAGVGGFASGLGSGEFCGGLRGECLLACERDHEAQAVYLRNHGTPTHGMHDDICTLARLPPGVDVLCAGFPCQSFSRANSGGQGLACPKNGFLFFEIIRLIKDPARAPRALLLENVRNLLDMDDGETFKQVTTELEQCGYAIFHKVIFSDELVGVPQRRERLYIVVGESARFAPFLYFKNDHFAKTGSGPPWEKGVENEGVFCRASASRPTRRCLTHRSSSGRLRTSMMLQQQAKRRAVAVRAVASGHVGGGSQCERYWKRSQDCSRRTGCQSTSGRKSRRIGRGTNRCCRCTSDGWSTLTDAHAPSERSIERDTSSNLNSSHIVTLINIMLMMMARRGRRSHPQRRVKMAGGGGGIKAAAAMMTSLGRTRRFTSAWLVERRRTLGLGELLQGR